MRIVIVRTLNREYQERKRLNKERENPVQYRLWSDSGDERLVVTPPKSQKRKNEKELNYAEQWTKQSEEPKDQDLKHYFDSKEE